MLRRTFCRVAACCMLLLTIFACSNFGSPTTIVKNELIQGKSAGSYQEVRHIVLRGTNQEIGRAIAQISNDYYQAQTLSFESLQYKSSRDSYIRQHFPALAERRKGIDNFYGWGQSDLHDSSALWYDMQPVACSAIFFPNTVTASGHSFQARNMDFLVVDMWQYLTGKVGQGNKLFSRNFVMETYPQDGGYATLVVGSFDLLNGAYDGFNEYGLSISGLVDHNLKYKTKDKTVDQTVPLSEIEQQEGLNYLQMARAILEGARTIDEAKNLVSTLKVYFPVAGMHFLIGDRSGKSMVLEFSEDDLSPRFIPQSSDSPAIMTNHSVYYYPTIDKVIPEVDKNTAYDTFYRYLRLYDYLQASAFHKYTTDDGLYAMSLVYGFANDVSEGTYTLPMRTLWSLVMDVDDLSLKIRFYTVDDNTLKTPVFTEAYTFRLQK